MTTRHAAIKTAGTKTIDNGPLPEKRLSEKRAPATAPPASHPSSDSPPGETAPTAALVIRLFGGLNLEFQGEERTAHFSGRLRALLALLLLEHNRAHQRQSVAFALWPDSTEKQARTNLRKLLLLLRSALGPCAEYLVVTDQTLCWRGDDQCWIDVVAFRQSVEIAKNERAPNAIQCFAQATALYRGDLLPDCYDEWIVACRELLREQFLHALHEWCGLLENEGRYGEGVAVARRILQHDPVNERGHLYLIRHQAFMQDRAGALQSYHRCATLLRRELGVDPSPALEALYVQLLDHDLAAVPLLPVQSEKSVPLIGRREAWKTLLASWHEAQRGAHFVLIVGEAGIGKSRLAEELLLWVERQGNVAAHSRAYRSDNRTLTHAPVAALLRSPVLAGEVRALNAYWLTEIARLLPEILLERDDVQPPQPMTDDWQRHHLFAALTQALLPKHRPRLVVIDDLQWCDSETLAWLPHLLEAAKDKPLLVVGTVRSEDFDDDDALQSLCETLRTLSTTSSGQLSEIYLGPLDGAAVGELAYHVAGNTLDEGQAAWMVQATEGNPLFVIETTRLWQDDAPFPPDSATPSLFSHRPETVWPRLPQSVLSVIEARLARLSKRARNLAEVAATIGRSFTLPVLAAASALEEDELVDALDELWRRRIIRERGADAYDFSHDRIRDGAYAGTSGLRRRLLHKRVAAAIVATHRGQSAGDHGEQGLAPERALDEMSGQLGYHYEQANERLLAIEHYLAAARLSSAQYAHAETLRYLDRVLALALPEEHAILFEALMCRDRVLEIAAPTAAWRENLEHIEPLAQMVERDEATAMRRRALVAERKSRLFVRQMELHAAVEPGRAAVDYAAKSGDLQLQAHCHYSLALRLWYIADFQEAIPHIEHAIEVARASGADEVLANALELRAQTHMFNGGSAKTISELLDECLVIHRRTGNVMGRCAILNKLGYLPVAQGAGRYEEAVEYYMEAKQVTQQLNLLQVQITVLRNLAVAYTCMGNYAAAEPYLTEAQAIYHAQGAQHDDPVLLNYRGFLDLNAGRLLDALDAQQRALAGLTTQGHRQWRVKALTALGWIHQRLGKWDEAMRYAEESLAQCRALNEQRQAAYTLILLGTLRTERGRTEAGDLAQARADFLEARAILHSFEMINRAQEAESGLAYLDFLTGDVAAARESAAGLLAHLETHPVDYTEDVCQMLFLCSRILAAIDAPNLPRLCRLIVQHFATRTATLDEASARLFWQMPPHAALRELCDNGM